jgi:hypothetical protein
MLYTEKTVIFNRKYYDLAKYLKCYTLPRRAESTLPIIFQDQALEPLLIR